MSYGSNNASVAHSDNSNTDNNIHAAALTDSRSVHTARYTRLNSVNFVVCGSFFHLMRQVLCS